MKSEKGEVKIPDKYEFSNFVQKKFLEKYPKTGPSFFSDVLYYFNMQHNGIQTYVADLVASMYSDKVSTRSEEDLTMIEAVKTQIKQTVGKKYGHNILEDLQKRKI